MDDQLRQVRAGRELANLDRVPNPNLPVPLQLRVPMPMVRPRFMPMMPMRPGPLPPGAVPGGLMMDPGAFAQPRGPVHTMAPVQIPMVHIFSMYIIYYIVYVHLYHGCNILTNQIAL